MEFDFNDFGMPCGNLRQPRKMDMYIMIMLNYERVYPKRLNSNLNTNLSFIMSHIEHGISINIIIFPISNQIVYIYILYHLASTDFGESHCLILPFSILPVAFVTRRHEPVPALCADVLRRPGSSHRED